MGNRQKGRKTEEWELEAISNLVGIPRLQINQVYKNFQRASKDYLLDKYEFRRMYKDLIGYSSCKDVYGTSSARFDRQTKMMADRIFQIFDNDHTGRLTFDEFIAIYIMLQNSVSPLVRLNFFLDHYSHSNDYITSHMGRRVLRDMARLYGINTDHQQVWRKIDRKSGFIPKQAFLDYFLSHPAYSSALYKNV